MKIDSTSEEQLVLALQQHASADFSRLYRAYAPALYGEILRMVNDPAWADDLLQDTFVKIWLNSHRYNPGQGRLFTWLVTITRRVALDALRAQKAQRTAGYMGVPAGEITHLGVTQEMVHESLLNYLAPKYRVIVDLLYYQGFTVPEVATTLNLPIGTVKTRARRALQLLKVYLQQDIHHFQGG